MKRKGPSLGYRLHMQSPEWAATRKRKLQQAGFKCQDCGTGERLEVHHLTYERFGHERLEDLQVLCHFCHMAEHGRPVHGVGPIAGLTARDHVLRGVGPALLQSQRGALHARLLEAKADEIDALAQTIDNPKARKLIKLAAKSLRAAAQHVSPVRSTV